LQDVPRLTRPAYGPLAAAAGLGVFRGRGATTDAPGQGSRGTGSLTGRAGLGERHRSPRVAGGPLPGRARVGTGPRAAQATRAARASPDPLDAVSRPPRGGRNKSGGQEENPKGTRRRRRGGAAGGAEESPSAARSAPENGHRPSTQARALVLTGPPMNLRTHPVSPGAHARRPVQFALLAVAAAPPPGPAPSLTTPASRCPGAGTGARPEFFDSQIGADRTSSIVPLVTGPGPGALLRRDSTVFMLTSGPETPPALLLIAAGDHPERLRFGGRTGAHHRGGRVAP